MIGDVPLLSATIFLPLVGVFALIVSPSTGGEGNDARRTALIVSAATFLLSLVLWWEFDPNLASIQMIEETTWLHSWDLGYRVGLDGLSLFFVLLSTLLTPICIIASWRSITTHVREYMMAFLVLETMMVGTFAAMDITLFYVFFEGVLIPMFLIIGIWGGKRRIYSAFKFFLYTLVGSVLMLIGMIYMISVAGTGDIRTLLHYAFDPSVQIWLWIAFFASFAVKVPMWPFHTWLPDAHVEAPTAGSVILAGVLLKLGGYGFLRFSVPMMPLATADLAPIVFWLSIVAVIYTSLVALVQEDFKKLIAYSSVAHMGFVTAGIFTVNQQALSGAVFQMLSHGLVSGALFLIVGVIYDRLHTREIARFEGLVSPMPRYALVFMVMMLASIGLPGTSGFVGEFLILAGTFQYSFWLSLLLATGMVLGAAYMLYVFRRVIFGVAGRDELKAMLDLNRREIICLAPLLVLVVVLGVYPTSVLRYVDPSMGRLLNNYERSVQFHLSQQEPDGERLASEGRSAAPRRGQDRFLTPQMRTVADAFLGFRDTHLETKLEVLDLKDRLAAAQGPKP